jgi:Flp pilus assembly protein TadD
MAAVYGFLADYAYEPVGPMLDSARLMARRAVTLDSTLPETRTALAVALGDAGQFDAAEHEFQRAIALGVRNARAHYWYSILLVALGRGEEALYHARRADSLDAFAPRGVKAMQRYAIYLITGKHPEGAMTYAQRRPVLEREPWEPWARAREAYDYAEDGNCAEAVPRAARARELVPTDNFRLLPFVGSVYWWCGSRAHARALVDSMKLRPDAIEQGYRIAMMYALFGERDSAFAWLPRHRWTMAELSGLRADRMLDSVRSDPRYPRLLRQLGLPDE